MLVNRSMQTGAKLSPGDTVSVLLELDTEPRKVDVPEILEYALKMAPKAAENFSNLSVSHKRKYVEWIMEAKKPGTRARRVTEAVERLLK